MVSVSDSSYKGICWGFRSILLWWFHWVAHIVNRKITGCETCFSGTEDFGKLNWARLVALTSRMFKWTAVDVNSIKTLTMSSNMDLRSLTSYRTCTFLYASFGVFLCTYLHLMCFACAKPAWLFPLYISFKNSLHSIHRKKDPDNQV